MKVRVSPKKYPIPRWRHEGWRQVSFRESRLLLFTDNDRIMSVNGIRATQPILRLNQFPDVGYAIGADEAVRAQSNRDLGRFLARVFSRKP